MPAVSSASTARHRTDRCPGVLRPWVAEDGALLRIRLVGGRLSRDQLAGLGELAVDHGDGNVHATARANLQVRGLPLPVPGDVAGRIAALGLLPSPPHERVRNIIMSPLTGRSAGAADLRPVAVALDAALCSDPALAQLPARFLFALDDRGDLGELTPDLAAVAVAPDRARLWAGGLAGDVVDLADVPERLVELARRFLTRRGTGPSACWHVAELPRGGADLGAFRRGKAAPRVAPPAPGRLVQDDGRCMEHVPVPDGLLTPAVLEHVLEAATHEVVVTPWRSLLIPDLETGS